MLNSKKGKVGEKARGVRLGNGGRDCSKFGWGSKLKKTSGGNGYAGANKKRGKRNVTKERGGSRPRKDPLCCCRRRRSAHSGAMSGRGGALESSSFRKWEAEIGILFYRKRGGGLGSLKEKGNSLGDFSNTGPIAT